MEQTIKFTKKNTLAVKGIAISFLLCYHCFSQTARMGGAEVSFWPLPQNLAMLISLCMVHCVGMFAFLSVYGLTLSMKSKYPEYDFDGHTATLFVLKRYVKLVFLLPGSFLIEKHVHLTKYLFIVPLAICFADQQVFERLKSWKPLKSQALSKFLKFVVSTGMILALLMLWNSRWALERFEFMLNGLIPVAIIYWAYEFLLDIPGLHQLLEFLGKYSATVFYIHTFIRTLWLRDFTYSLGHAAVIWLFLMGSSILIAVFLDVVKKLIHYEKISNVVIDGFIGWADRTLW